MRTSKNKYGNKKVEYENIIFDSKRERDRYIFLKQAQDKGEIYNLQLQPKWELIPKITEQYVKHLKTKDKICYRTAQLAITYTADFSYNKAGGEFVVEDVKASPRLVSRDVPLRIKLMRYFHSINVRLIYKYNERI